MLCVAYETLAVRGATVSARFVGISDVGVVIPDQGSSVGLSKVGP
jgi:hypothetical protein